MSNAFATEVLHYAQWCSHMSAHACQNTAYRGQAHGMQPCWSQQAQHSGVTAHSSWLTRNAEAACAAYWGLRKRSNSI